MRQLRYIRVDHLLEPETPIRELMDDVKFEELCESIRLEGVLQNLVVVRVKVDHPDSYPATSEGSKQAAEDARVRYRVMAGHRRLLACRAVRVKEVPAMVYENEEAAAEAILFAENACREDVNPMDEARWFAELLAKHDWTEEQLCNQVHKKASYIYDRLKLREYSEPLQLALREGKVTQAVAKELHRCPDEEHRHYLLDIAVTGGLTGPAARSMVNQFLQQPAQPGPQNGNGEPSFSYVEPSESPLVCVVCGGNKDPQNLAWVAVHKWELEAFKRLIGAQQKLVGA